MHVESTFLEVAFYLLTFPHVKVEALAGEGRQGSWLVMGPVLSTPGTSHYTLGQGSWPTCRCHAKWRR